MSDPLNEINRVLGRIENMVKNIETNQSAIHQKLDDHESRLEGVEGWKKAIAFCALIGSTIGTGIATAWEWVSKLIMHNGAS